MKRLIVILLSAIVLEGAVGYGVYAKACEMNNGKCCGRCELPPKPR